MGCLFGDMPCNQPCDDRTCMYNHYGLCQDNWVCDRCRRNAVGEDDKEKEVA